MDATPTDEQMAAGLRQWATNLKAGGPYWAASQADRDRNATLLTQAAARLSSLTPPALQAELDRLREERTAALAAIDGVDLREGHIRDNPDPDQLRAMLLGAGLTIARLTAERDSLAAFKRWTHGYLDQHGVPHHPPGTHGAAGCRIGDRMDWLMDRLRRAESAPPKEIVEAAERCIDHTLDVYDRAKAGNTLAGYILTQPERHP